MTLLQAAVLGFVQGLTEFLPVSSSGHLVLANYTFGWGENLPLYSLIATNTGTLLAVLIVLRRDVAEGLGGFLAGLGSASGRQRPGWHLAWLVLAGSVPTAVIGLGVESLFRFLNSPLPVACSLAITGFLLWFAPRGGAKTKARELTIADALFAGLAQGLAVIPGISRSGATIAALLWRNAGAELAARLSFLMYLVVSTGVALLAVLRLSEEGLDWAPLLVMTATSFATGYLALLWLFSILRRGAFRWFAPYLWTVAALTLIRVLTA